MERRSVEAIVRALNEAQVRYLIRMNDTIPPEERLWEEGWEGHLRAQRRRTAALPLTEKLQWLEEAQRLLAHFAAQRRLAGKNTLTAGDHE